MVGKLRRTPIDYILGFGQPERFGSRRLLGKYREGRFESRWSRRRYISPTEHEPMFCRDGGPYFGHHCRLCWCADRPFHERKARMV